jgi:hypothetical protein
MLFLHLPSEFLLNKKNYYDEVPRDPLYIARGLVRLPVNTMHTEHPSRKKTNECGLLFCTRSKKAASSIGNNSYLLAWRLAYYCQGSENVEFRSEL